jgi:hypothetical protein
MDAAELVRLKDMLPALLKISEDGQGGCELFVGCGHSDHRERGK